MMVSLVLGIISVLLSLNGILGISLMGFIYGMTFTMWGAPITGIAGIIAGIITKNKGGQSDNKKFAVAGLLCSIVGLNFISAEQQEFIKSASPVFWRC